MVINNNKILSLARTQRMIYSIEDYLNPIDPSLAERFSSSYDRYSDNGQTFSIMRANNNDDRCENLHLNKDLVFCVDAQRQFSEPIKLSVLQKGYIRIIFLLAGELDITGPDDKTHSLLSQHGFISRSGHAPMLYTTSRAQTFSAVSMIASPQALQMLIGISADELPGVFNKLLNQCNSDTFSEGFNLDGNTLQLLIDIVKPTNDPIALRQLYLKSKLLELIYSVVQYFYCHEQPIIPSSFSCQPSLIKRLNKARELIENRLSDPPSTHELCELAGISRVKLIKQFKHIFGLTPHQYCLDQRFKYARKLLVEEGRSISEVADQVGYKELSSFSREFRARFGQAPSDISKTFMKI